MQHFVIHDVFDDKSRNGLPIKLLVYDDLLERRIETSQESTPSALTPSDNRLCERIFKILLIQGPEHRLQIVVCSGGAVLRSSGARLTLGQQAAASGPGIGKLAICMQQIFWRFATIQFAQQDRSGRFDHGVGCVVQCIGQPDVGGILAQPDGVREIRVRMKFDYKRGRPTFAPEPGIDSLKKFFAPGNGFTQTSRGHEGFLRTGTGVNSLAALSASSNASLVPSIASSNVSL